jgi:ribosomal protein L12E/L44/L45/RPP1/RPP2
MSKLLIALFVSAFALAGLPVQAASHAGAAPMADAASAAAPAKKKAKKAKKKAAAKAEETKAEAKK